MSETCSNNCQNCEYRRTVYEDEILKIEYGNRYCGDPTGMKCYRFYDKADNGKAKQAPIGYLCELIERMNDHNKVLESLVRKAIKLK